MQRGLILFVVCALTLAAHGQSIREIRIRSSWDGFGPAMATEVVLNGANGTLKPARAEELKKVLSQPLEKVSLDNLGVTKEWLASHPDIVKDRDPSDSIRITAMSTDDYPKVKMAVIFDNGEIWNIESDSQAPFMLPWSINSGLRSGLKSYDARIGRMIAEWLPSNGVNRERLNGKGLDKWLEQQADALKRFPGILPLY